ncbi:MAG: tRNA-dihydrouridine synthase [Patescibacteria group bacterium]
MFHWDSCKRPIVALAPMAGVTDASLRQLQKSLAPEVIVFTEFLSIDAIAYGAKKTLQMLAFDAALERPFIVQIFGNDLGHIASSCAIIEEMGADGIDINMGCPAAKIVSSCYGSALLRRRDLAIKVVEAAVNAAKIPVSVKTRLGWENAEDLIPFCKKLVDAGAAALSIHGRTYKDKFGGSADWNPIYELKRQVSVPVLGNGDIRSAADAIAKIGNLDGVMVGRGTIGNPWLLREICDVLRGVTLTPPLTLEQKIPVILRHCELAVKYKGERRGIIEMRKHFGGYIKGFDGAKELRMRLMETETMEEVESALSVVRSQYPLMKDLAAS